MNFDTKLPIPEKLYEQFSRAARSRMDFRPMEQILHQVIEHWIRFGFEEDGSHSTKAGYQWKALFLPHASRLRLYYQGKHYYAEIIEDDFVFAGESSSPNRMVVSVTGGRRNAWRDLYVLLPEQSVWVAAGKLRD